MDLRPILAANVATEECHTRCNLGRRCFHRVNYHSGKTMKTQESGLETSMLYFIPGCHNIHPFAFPCYACLIDSGTSSPITPLPHTIIAKLTSECKLDDELTLI